MNEPEWMTPWLARLERPRKRLVEARDEKEALRAAEALLLEYVTQGVNGATMEFLFGSVPAEAEKVLRSVWNSRSDEPRADAIAEAAVDLGARIAPVIPMRTIWDGSGRRQNIPVVPGWPYGASRDPDLRSFGWGLATNVALALGGDERLFVIEPQPGAEIEGQRRFIAGDLQQELPATLSIHNVSTGVVFNVFRWPEPVPVFPLSRLPTVGGSQRVYCRGERQWMTCPPGTAATRWMSGRGPGEIDVAEAPGWAVGLILNAFQTAHEMGWW